MGNPESVETDSLHDVFSAWQQDVIGTDDVMEAINPKLLGSQVDIIGLPMGVTWTIAVGDLLVRKLHTSRSEVNVGRSDRLVQLMGGTLVSMAFPEPSIWVAAAKPSQISESSRMALKEIDGYRFWKFHLDSIAYLAEAGWPLKLPNVAVNEHVLVQPLNRIDRDRRMQATNRYWFGNDNGPGCMDNRGIGPPDIM